MIKNILEQDKIDQFKALLGVVNKVVIVAHVSPDGDAIGSSLGLAQFLTNEGKSVSIIMPNAFPDFLKWMNGSDKILNYERNKDRADQLISEADMICCLDFNGLKRIDEMEMAVREAQGHKVMIDHHLYPEDFCEITMSHPEISSTSEVVFRLIERMGGFEQLDKTGAEAIYTGMMTDTGGFTYNSNQPDIYYIISRLLSKGIDKDAIYRNVFNTYSEGRLRLMGYVLYEKMQVFDAFNSALITLNSKELESFHYVKGDSEGFVNIPLQIKNVIFSTFFREDKQKGMIKVSLRSVGDFPCNLVAAEFFNGGGHKNASGGEVYGTMDEAITLYKQALVKYESLLLNKK